VGWTDSRGRSTCTEWLEQLFALRKYIEPMSTDNNDEDSASKIVVADSTLRLLPWNVIARRKLPFVGFGHVYRRNNDDGLRRDHEPNVSARSRTHLRSQKLITGWCYWCDDLFKRRVLLEKRHEETVTELTTSGRHRLISYRRIWGKTEW